MSYTMMNPQPAGLDTNEVAVTLDNGLDVAVCVGRVWAPNNAGLNLTGKARLINADGTSVKCPMGNTVETIATHLSPQSEITAYGVDALSKCMVLAVLGEPITTTTVDSGGTSVTQPIIPWSADALANFSIRHAASMVDLSASGPVSGLSSLL